MGSMPMKPAGDSDLRGFEGRTVDRRYVLGEWIGGGGFGGVFRSEQYILGRPVRTVACKVSRRTGLTEDTAAELFADVLLLAETMGAMTDTEARRHLVQVHDGGLARDLGGRAFLVMEHIQGTTLAAEFTAMGQVQAPLLVKWARQICLALRGLHGMVPPLLHRDLKPDNVLLGTDGSVRLIDFGLAARMLELGHVPGTVGTIHYMAPETAAGASLPESDLYSLGLLMYEGLTGRHAYAHLVPPHSLPERSHGDWLQEQKELAPPLRPSALNNSVGPALDALVMRCLRMRPAHRFRSADELLTALDSLDGPATAPPVGATELARARRARTEGDTSASLPLLLRTLEQGRPAPDQRPALTAELAETYEVRGRPDEAARQWAAAYELVRSGAAAPAGLPRAELARRAERAFRQAGNRFQADHFARLCRTEQGRR